EEQGETVEEVPRPVRRDQVRPVGQGHRDPVPRKAEAELAVAVADAVQVFGDERSASEGLDMPVEAIRRFVAIAASESDAADPVDPVGAAGTP
ncbi:hypothetical protein ABZ372_43780, partial [Streptomyces sp. NPDC005921]